MQMNDALNLIESNKSALKRRLFSVLKNPADVDDALQDAYVRMLEVDQTDNEIWNVPAFLGRTGRNIAIDRVRRRQRTERIFVSSDESDEMRNQWLNCSTPERSPEETLSNKQLLNFVLAALFELPEKCRRAYVMSCTDDQTYKEIAQEVGVSVSMVEKYVARARQHVQSVVWPAMALVS